jgi:hypothetical protein
MQPVQRMIATLEIEASMIESHAEKLVSVASVTTDDEQKRELLQLSNEETLRADTIRRQIRLLQDHLGGADSRVA